MVTFGYAVGNAAARYPSASKTTSDTCFLKHDGRPDKGLVL